MWYVGVQFSRKVFKIINYSSVWYVSNYCLQRQNTNCVIEATWILNNLWVDATSIPILFFTYMKRGYLIFQERGNAYAPNYYWSRPVHILSDTLILASGHCALLDLKSAQRFSCPNQSLSLCGGWTIMALHIANHIAEWLLKAHCGDYVRSDHENM